MYDLPSMQVVADVTGYRDPHAADMFREGASIIGDLPVSGLGKVFESPAVPSYDELKSSFSHVNNSLLNSLTEDKHSDELMSQVCAEYDLNRMIPPVKAASLDLEQVLCARLFGVEQGTKPSGEAKVRSCVDETDNGVNGACRPREKLQNDNIDMLIVVIQLLCLLTGETPRAWKADIDSAYRRIPCHPDHRHLLWIMFLFKGEAWASRHVALPFGCTASVHAWNRIGGLLFHVGRKLLHIPLLRYVDDLFSADRSQCAEHAMMCFARLVRAISGSSSVQERKLCCEAPLTVLGVTVTVESDCITVFPSAEKICKWTQQLEPIRASKVLHSGEAGKMAGRLGFASQHAFSKLGRSMLRPFFAQQ